MSRFAAREDGSAGRSATARLAAAALILVAIAGLIALGTWQLQRRIWKLQLIATVTARLHGSAAPAPEPAEWSAVTAQRDAYRKVRISGMFNNKKETLVLAVTELGGGYWVLTPLTTPEGFTVLINRGFVPDDLQTAASRRAGQIEGLTTITGLLRLSEPGGGFLRGNDAATDRWYSRDVAAIGRSRGLSSLAPYFIDADSRPNAGGWPVGGLTVVHFTNHHLVYALTWYGMAALLIWASLSQVWKRRRGPPNREGVLNRAEPSDDHARPPRF